MQPLLKEIRNNPLLWLLVFVPVVFAAQSLKPGAHTLLFVLSVFGHRAPGGAPQPRHRVGGVPRRAMRSADCSTPRWAT